MRLQTGIAILDFPFKAEDSAERAGSHQSENNDPNGERGVFPISELHDEQDAFAIEKRISINKD